MSTSIADAKRRIVLPGATPGDVYDIQKVDESRFVLIKLQRPDPPRRKKKADVLRAISDSPLHPAMSWEELKKTTREP